MVNACTRVAGQQSDRSVVIGFMMASAALSMWISNTATTLMLLPIALAILEKAKNPFLPVALMLGIAYAANVGGIGTPIGTPPNLVFMEVYAEFTGERMGFVRWMSWGVPVVLVLVPIIAWWLTRKLADSELASLSQSLCNPGPRQLRPQSVEVEGSPRQTAAMTAHENLVVDAQMDP